MYFNLTNINYIKYTIMINKNLYYLINKYNYFLNIIKYINFIVQINRNL